MRDVIQKPHSTSSDISLDLGVGTAPGTPPPSRCSRFDQMYICDMIYTELLVKFFLAVLERSLSFHPLSADILKSPTRLLAIQARERKHFAGEASAELRRLRGQWYTGGLDAQADCGAAAAACGCHRVRIGAHPPPLASLSRPPLLAF